GDVDLACVVFGQSVHPREQPRDQALGENLAERAPEVRRGEGLRAGEVEDDLRAVLPVRLREGETVGDRFDAADGRRESIERNPSSWPGSPSLELSVSDAAFEKARRRAQDRPATCVLEAELTAHAPRKNLAVGALDAQAAPGTHELTQEIAAAWLVRIHEQEPATLSVAPLSALCAGRQHAGLLGEVRQGRIGALAPEEANAGQLRAFFGR